MRSELNTLARGARWALVFLAGGPAWAACAHLPAWIAPSRVEMRAWLVDSVLASGDTLRIRRIIRNNGPRPIWLSWGATDVSFGVRDASGQAACTYDGVYLLDQLLVRVAPGAETTHHVDWPLAQLGRCGPGNYRVDISDSYSTDVRGSGAGGQLKVRPIPLTIVSPSHR